MEIPPPRFPPPPRAKPPRKIGGWFPTPAPKQAANDARTMFNDMNRRKWLFLGLSIAITFFMLYGFWLDSSWDKIKPGPQLIYAESWDAERSDAAIKAEQKRTQALQRQAEERRRAEYERLSKRLGID